MPLVLCILTTIHLMQNNMVFPIAVGLAQETCWVISGTSCVIFSFSKKVFVGKVLVYVNTWRLVVLQKSINEFWKKPLPEAVKKNERILFHMYPWFLRIERINHTIIYNAVSSFLVLSWKVWVLCKN